ncbi:MAG TPA: hypothetical protein VI997_07450, partial [Candidatus Thermoplasmatota archaeon]|nr:hypothetical protein [Candidatus Thermoplasmatota archaeon]
PPPHHRNGNSPPAASAATPPPPPPELPPAVLDAPAAPPEPPVLPPPAEFPTLPDWTPLGSFCGWAQDLPTECGTVSLAARLISVPAGNIWVAKTENPKFTTKPKFRPHSDYHHHAHHNGELNAFQYHEF